MLPGPVFNVELLTLARRKRHYVLRFLYGFLLLYLIFQNDAVRYVFLNPARKGELTRQQLVMLARILFATFSFTQVSVILLMTPALVAGVVADERRRKTLHYLLASRLSSAEIVLGKLFARLLNILVFLGVGLPIFAILTFFGGIDPAWVFLFFASCATTAFFLGSAAVAISVRVKRPQEAVALTYLLVPVWLFGPSLVSYAFPLAGGFWFDLYHWIRPLSQWVGASSPFFLLQRGLMPGPSISATFHQMVLWMVGLQVLYGSVLAGLAVVWLRPIHRAEGASAGRFLRELSQKARRFFPRPPCGDDAIFWKERYVSRTTPLTKVAGIVAFAMVTGLLGYVTYQAAEPAIQSLRTLGYWTAIYGPSHHAFNGYLRVIVTVISCCWIIGSAAAAANGLSGEREEDTWISLIATPLTPAEIVRAKMFGAFHSVRFLGLLWLPLMLTGLILGGIHPIGVAVETALTAVYLWFAVALGTVFSLHSLNSNRALVRTMASLMVCNGVYLLLLLPFPWESSLRYLGVMPFSLVTALVSYEDTQVPAGRLAAEAFDYAVTAIVSFGAYLIAALMLTFYVVVDFDDAIDRPRTIGGRAPKARGQVLSIDDSEEPADD